MTKEINVPFLIVGGGIGGLATALGVTQTGRSVHVLEQAPEFGEIGAGIQLAPNATAVLDKLGVLDAISEYAVFPKRLVLMDAFTGKELSALNLGEASSSVTVIRTSCCTVPICTRLCLMLAGLTTRLRW